MAVSVNWGSFLWVSLEGEPHDIRAPLCLEPPEVRLWETPPGEASILLGAQQLLRTRRVGCALVQTCLEVVD